ncbi:hypothetical protein C6A86_017100 [Mycobacterium sp. ITM-2016-00316]|uniref:hypothetical protein n=1 Tax=Mycobacterium sp. ITM-2016-00316 TaxID=2099695 RepID=UPI000CF9F95F|nr:hypothetical protein [Mycobacterium sp. ITM-2016-00316]WNG79983.1 hypothetical protein C6A86_017100 [Mycobacterium sp. ITM-2016-00316]
MSLIAHSPYARDVALWVAGGDQAAFTSALSTHERAAWTCGHTGDVDESMWTFDDREWWIARCLARQGHNVIALPPRPVAGLRSPDAAVSGLLVEFKTYRGMDPRQLLRKVGEARPQADRAVIGVEAQWDPAMVRSIFRAAIHSAIRCRMRAVMFIGDEFQFEWGDWNPCFTPPEESVMGALAAAPCHRPVRRLQPCPTPPLSLRT